LTHIYLKRALTDRLIRLFEHFSAVVVIGARQVGKSTLLKNVFPSLPCVVFDPVRDIQNARSDPDLFLDNHPPPIILDEIQYAPELIAALKRRIDLNKKPGLYLLTGSQQWGVLKQIAESMAGRVVLTQLEGFSLSELAQQVDTRPWLQRWLEDPKAFLKEPVKRLSLSKTLYQQLWRGFLPEANFIPEDLIPDFQASYQRTYIERDIRLLAEVADLQQFGRFVQLCAALTAQEVNYSELGRDIGITPQTAKRWLSILQQTFEWFEIPAYSNNSIKKVSLKAKGYLADSGQVCFSQMISSPQAIATHPLQGALYETAVVADIRKQLLTMSTPAKLYHWRVYSGAECDLILERDGKFFPIEIKLNSQPKRGDARGIEAFRQAYPHLNIEPGLIIAPTETRYALSDNNYVIPWDLC
jgi:uncharacterized protein